MHVLITGGTGFIGKKLANRILQQNGIALAGGRERAIEKVTITDRSSSREGFVDDPRLDFVFGEFTDAHTLGRALCADIDVIFHLAAVVSGQAEQEFETGLRVNLQATINLLETCRQLGNCPLVIFTSSVAVYGGDLPDTVTDSTRATPQNSYGAQKAACEILINDYSRKGYIDGRSLRLPTIIVRPGRPNAAASSFASGIIREPLQGQMTVCPVVAESRMWVMSPRTVITNLIHALTLSAAQLGTDRTIPLPGTTVSVAVLLDTMGRLTSDRVIARVKFQPDQFIQRIVNGWPATFDLKRCIQLGFDADPDVESFITGFIDDELNGGWIQ